MTEPKLPLALQSIDAWSALQPGSKLSVVKLAPDGSEAARYPGEVVVGLDQDAWIVVHAEWTHRAMDLDGLEFRTGDHLFEWFSPHHPLNAFAVLTRAGCHKGWYANVTYPARLDPAMDPPVLIWHDLFVDLVGLADKTFTIRDDDELEASGLRQFDLQLHAYILSARSGLIWRFEHQLPPFVGLTEMARIRALRDEYVSVE